MMKIAFVYDAVYPWIKGGAEMRIHANENGHHIIIKPVTKTVKKPTTKTKL